MTRSALIVISDLEYGGAQRQVVELANNMPPGEFDVHVCALADYVPLASSLRDRERCLHIVQRQWHYDFTVVLRLVALCRKLKVDILHGYLFDAQIATRLAGLMAGIPVIGSERNANYAVSRGNYLVYRLTQRCVRLTIANSSAGADFHTRYFRQPRERVRVVHNGVDVERFHPGDGTKTRTEVGLESKHFVVGMFASFKEQKNQLLLLRAARLLVGSYRDLRILFVGDELFGGGSDSHAWKARILQEVEAQGLHAFCVFAGNRPDVERFYRACDLTVLPSSFEGTPNVVLESMASGVPVVATDVSDNRFIIPDGRVGFVVKPDDEVALAEGISKFLEDENLRVLASREARARAVAEFSCARLAEKTAEVYREAIA